MTERLESPQTPNPPPGAEGNAGRKALLIMISQYVQAACGLLGIVITGHYIPPGALGSYSWAIVITGWVAALGNFGIGQAHQRHIAMGVPVRKAQTAQLVLRLAGYGLVIVLFILGVWIVPGARQLVLKHATLAVIAAATLAQILAAIRQFPMETWQAQQKVNRNEIIKFVDTVASIAFLAMGAFAVGSAAGAYPAPPHVFSRVAAALGIRPGINVDSVALIVAGSYLMGKVVSMGPAAWWWIVDRMGFGAWDAALAKTYLRFGLPVALTAIITIVIGQTDQFVIGAFWPDAATLGLYAYDLRVVAGGSIPAVAVGIVLFPKFTALFAAGDRVAALRVFRSAERYTFMVTALPAIALIAMSGVILSIIGSKAYVPGATALQWLAVGLVLNCLMAPLSMKFLGSNALRVSVIAASISAFLNLALNLFLVPPAQHLRFPESWWMAPPVNQLLDLLHVPVRTLGMAGVGSAIASLAATLVSYLYLRARAHTAYGLSWFEPALLRIGLVATATGALWWWAVRRLPSGLLTRWWQVGIAGVAGALVYFLLLVATRELDKEDLRVARGVLHPGELFAELRGRR
ncbi:MAG: hypothetical protein ACYDBQ_12385 [Thermoplasmatota archaeon]